MLFSTKGIGRDSRPTFVADRVPLVAHLHGHGHPEKKRHSNIRISTNWLFLLGISARRQFLEI
jgi:hypothetical protein